MTANPSDPTQRFSDRVDNYSRYRPGYPAGVLDILRDETGLTTMSVVADVGSGTGILSELFLRNGNPVACVEPNAEMRHAAEKRLRGYPEFQSVAGSAEETTLTAATFDYVVAGQAFHWFDRPRARDEFARILQPGGWVALVWNSRRTDATPFMRDYEALLQQFAIDYRQVQHENVTPEVLAGWFLDGRYQTRTLYNEQRLDFEGLKGRLLSSSYAPNESHPNCGPMLEGLRDLRPAPAGRPGVHRVQHGVVLWARGVKPSSAAAMPDVGGHDSVVIELLWGIPAFVLLSKGPFSWSWKCRSILTHFTPSLSQRNYGSLKCYGTI